MIARAGTNCSCLSGQVRDQLEVDGRVRDCAIAPTSASRYVYRAVATLRASGTGVPDELLQHLSPLAWEQIVRTGEHRLGSDETRQPGSGARRAGLARFG
jgi:hypothetical protein